MIKNQKGVTITILVITIIILFILAGVTFTATTDLMSDSKVKIYVTDMYLVQSKAESLYEEYSFTGEALTNNAQMGTKVNVSELSKYHISPDGTTDEFWYKWDQATLANNGLDAEMLKSGEAFIVNYENLEVVYTKGYSDKDGNYYYTLSELLQIK